MERTVDPDLQAAREQRARENLDPGTFPHKGLLPCDIVMKGGITSGVVYPGAVLRLARRYKFCSIGGTSAGAIAAVVVAAAEHARDQDGFTRVAAIPEKLAEKGFMLQLFQGDPPTRPLLRSITGFMEHGNVRGTARLLGTFWKGPAVAAAVAGTSIALTAVGDADPAYLVGGLAASAVILGAGLAADLARAVGRIRDNDFGLSRLGPDADTPNQPALTQWLHEQVQYVAGRTEHDGPLTFADLWGVPAPADPQRPLADWTRFQALIDHSRDPSLREVDLQMVTTDLTHGRPIRLPVPFQQHRKRPEEEAGRLLFDPHELKRFFARDVVEHLERHAKPLGAKAAGVAKLAGHGRLRTFPIGPDLPVVVAARMSLSFPFLISSVPLWRMTLRDGVVVGLDRVRFSDGGVTSNFPIHFFDSPLPTRPTFGLHLTDFGAEETPDLADPSQAVVPPGRSSDPAPDPVQEIESLGAFLGALKNAGQNWRDNAQASLPGFRDRIVHIKLAKHEGGLNLAMETEDIKRLDDRGDFAGRELIRLFAGDDGDGPAKHWNDHRFTRYRTTMALAERWMRSYRRGWSDEPEDPVTMPYRDRVEAGLVKPYAFDNPTVRDAAIERGDEYAAIVHAPSLDDRGIPRPPSTLRTVPPV